MESSVKESERGEGCCCHSRKSKRRERREGNEAAVTGSTEMRRCGSEAQDEDLDENVFTGQCVSVHYVCICVVYTIIYILSWASTHSQVSAHVPNFKGSMWQIPYKLCIYILGKRPCGPKSQVKYKHPWGHYGNMYV